MKPQKLPSNLQMLCETLVRMSVYLYVGVGVPFGPVKFINEVNWTSLWWHNNTLECTLTTASCWHLYHSQVLYMSFLLQIIPSIHNEDPYVRDSALNCLGLISILDREQAAVYFYLFVQVCKMHGCVLIVVFGVAACQKHLPILAWLLWVATPFWCAQQPRIQ